ncbi:hypothetical protein GCM10022393_42140 [Aquimarina addita]|uniref:histidine kinase n=1 Tax=Aquimarina addita TaxID=870485 RepID=A0ABP6UYM5_9FLAO
MRENVRASWSFLNDILKKSDHLIFILKPISDSRKIVDFTIEFVTDNITSLVNLDIEDFLNNKIVSVFPEILENGIFEILTACYGKPDMEISFERKLTLCQKTVWLQCYAIRKDETIVVTCNNITDLKKSDNKLKATNKRLELQNKLLNEAEEISKSASFQWNIFSGSWIISENIKNLFNDILCKKMREGNGIFEIMPVNDRKKILSEIEVSKYDDNLTEQYFSVFNEKEKRNFSLTGNFVPVKGGQLMLGVIKDITEIRKNEIIIIKSNEELVRINAELDSFNHIASHDLQEPLRKIQMFISRISEKDIKAMSQNGKNFLTKIESSAERMQELIKHLLTYSRIGKAGVAFEKVDLQQTLEVILEDVFDESEKGRVSLQKKPLPTILGIPFLIHQLFYNIITNAIKYKHPDRILQLEISSKIEFHLDDRSLKTRKEGQQFVEIIFKDNGIGFQQEHEHKIFELFQRLHQKNEYSGTGIGLAICKKITDTHHGKIKATGNVNQGAIFSVALPV